MRIRRLEITAFGRLRDVSSGEDPLGGFVVVQGRNEAGKSSVFEFLCSLLYGIYPTSPDRHPFAPWDGTELAGGATLRVSDGGEMEVSRRLLSSPSGSLRRNGHSENLRNDDLPFVDHVSRKVFRQVYALGLAEVASLDAEGWEAVQDRILGRLGATDLRSAREVAAELETEARALWRPDRRGQPRIRKLDEAIRDVAARRPAARQRADRRRRAADRLIEVRRVLESARAARAADQRRLERLRVLVPVRTELAHIAELRLRAGPAERLDGLPTDPAADLARRRERVQAAEREVQAALDERSVLALEIGAVTDADRALLAHEAAIETLRSRVAVAEPMRARLAGAEQEVRGLERRLQDEADRLDWAGVPDPEALAGIPPGPLADAFRRWDAASTGAGRIASGSEQSPPSHTGTALVIMAVGAVLSTPAFLSLAGASTFDDLPPLLVAGLALVALVLAVTGWSTLGRERRARATRATAAARAREAATRRDEERDRARRALGDLLAPAGLKPGAEPDPQMPARIDRCRQWLRDLKDLHGEIAAIRTGLADLDTEATALADLVPEGRGVGGAAGAATVLLERLKEARDRDTAARRAQARLGQVDELLGRGRDRMAAARAALDDLRRLLASFVPDDAERAAEVAAHCLEAMREADTRLARLRAERADLDNLRRSLDAAAAAAEPWLEEADPLASLQREIDIRTEEIEGWVADARDLEAQVTVTDGEETLDDLEGELRSLREERARLRREHDRLWILSRLVEGADRKVRELHQPEILRLAGAHLKVLTGDRYDRVEVADDRDRRLRVSGPAAPQALDVGPPLSTGTREQIYIALRLALVDHLDDGGERLPLFLDEVLVNWDPERRARGLDLLERTATERQVFLFTCHPDLADDAVARGATRWRLEGP